MLNPIPTFNPVKISLIADGIFIGGRFESYTDLLGTSNMDKYVKEFNYSYSVYITFDRSFFLGKPGKFE